MLCSRPQLPETSSGSLILLLGDQRISAFAWKSYAEYPGFHRYRALGILEFFSEHSLVYCRQCRPIYRPNSGRYSGRQWVDTRSIQRSIVGRQSVDSWSIVSRQSVDSQSIVGQTIGPVSVDISTRRTPIDYRSYVGDISVNCRQYIGQLSVEYQSCINLAGESNGFLFKQ